MAKAASRPLVQLPKDSLSKITLGKSFAEYDRVLTRPGVFVETPAIKAAMDASRSKCFFVGRRGTGKTAITLYLRDKKPKTTTLILPQIFSSLGEIISSDLPKETSQRRFKSLVACFKWALLDEALSEWRKQGLFHSNRLPESLARERNYIDDQDFDIRMMHFVEATFEALKRSNDKEWLRLLKRPDQVLAQMEASAGGPAWERILLIDRIDESWDGSDEAVILLMALMHACVQLCAKESIIRPVLFLRENIFDRVREIDNEFARLETFVVSLDWSTPLLLELVERRLNLPFNTKLSLGGTTWDYFFEPIEGESSRAFVFDYCQQRPRDVLTFCVFAIESAQAQKHQKVGIEDFQEAKGRFSQNRLKDLADEYSENYPQIQLVLTRFYGLGRKFNLTGIAAFIQKLLLDEEVKRQCGSWIYNHTAAESFIELLYNIGFWGVEDGTSSQFRSLGSQSPALPPINKRSVIVVHPSYIDALNLQNIIVGGLDEIQSLQTSGILADITDGEAHRNRLEELQEELKTLPAGDVSAAKYEEVVGDIIRLCFYRSLTNIEQKVRNVDGRVIRDWIAANRSSTGFWEMVRLRYQATQVIWECKNYTSLGADAFHQAEYYMTAEIGQFVVLSFRGDEIKKHYYEHIKRISNAKQGGIVLLLMDKDLQVFIRQELNGGKIKEDHIQGIFDRTIRMIS